MRHSTPGHCGALQVEEAQVNLPGDVRRTSGRNKPASGLLVGRGSGDDPIHLAGNQRISVYAVHQADFH